MRKLKYSFEYCCSPIWLQEVNVENPIFENVFIDVLDLDEFLKKEIKELELIYQFTYNEDDGRESGFENLYEFSIFVNRVLLSAELLKINLKNRFEIIFDEKYWNSLIVIIKKELNNESPK